MTTDSDQPRLLTILVPVYNEGAVLQQFHQRLKTALSPIEMSFEIIYINDGSQDDTLVQLQQLHQSDPDVAIIDLSRNFGKEVAMSAGLDNSHGDAVVIIDADLQDPPELIPELVERWQQGFDVVYAKRAERDGETILKKLTAWLFYRVIGSMSDVEIPADTGDFRLLSRRTVEAIRQLPERHRFMKGLFNWVGFEKSAVMYHRDPRAAGDTKFNYWRLWNFALEGITSHTTLPLKLASYLGTLIASCSFLFAAYIIYDKLVNDNPVAGYPSLIVIVLFLGGVQLLTLGVIGEYLARISDESKQRPLYFTKSIEPARSASATEPESEN